jgi:hypothetical protein
MVILAKHPVVNRQDSTAHVSGRGFRLGDMVAWLAVTHL